jgi:hypothetical protein
MAMLALPADSADPSYAFEVELEGSLYRFELHWNDRDGAWFLSLYDATETLLVAGRKVVLGANLLGKSAEPALPPGLLLILDTSGANADPGRDDLGERCPLIYVESTGT